jgi:hypothetical protein
MEGSNIMVNYDCIDQVTNLLRLSNIPGVSELDDRAAESVSGGYRVAFYSGKNGTGKVVYTHPVDIKSIAGRDGANEALIGDALSFRIIGGPKGSQYKLTTNASGGSESQYQNYTGFTHRAVNFNNFDKMYGIYGYDVNRIK